MGNIELVTTAGKYNLAGHPEETLLEVFRRNNIPIQGTMPLDEAGRFVSLSYRIKSGDRLRAYALRNVDFKCVLPHYSLVTAEDPVTELVRPLHSPQNLGLVQFPRESAMQYIYSSVEAALDCYTASRTTKGPLQLALSPGGDGRVLIECIRRYWDEHPEEDFAAVIVAVGFEDEKEHLSAGIELAKRFEIPHEALGVREAADLLGYRGDLNEISEAYRRTFPQDEAEVMLTYWVQNLNFAIATRSGRRAILFGYNQEDVIAERLYQALTGNALEPYPVRRTTDFDLIAPLCQVPKKMLDAMDVENSLRNYRLRTPSVSYLRSSLYLLSYVIAEQFPALADVFSGPYIQPEAPDELLTWLATK
jgi:hypothetical protein